MMNGLVRERQNALDYVCVRGYEFELRLAYNASREN